MVKYKPAQIQCNTYSHHNHQTPTEVRLLRVYWKPKQYFFCRAEVAAQLYSVQ